MTSDLLAVGSLTHSRTELPRWAADVARTAGLTQLLPATPGERTWRRLDAPPGWDAWLIAWPEGTGTGWHDHQGSAGVFRVVSGVLTEFSFAGAASSAPLAASVHDVRTRRFDAGQARAFGPNHLHHMVNEYPRTAYSVHVYAPGLRGMTRYEWDDDTLVVTGVDTAGQW